MTLAIDHLVHPAPATPHFADLLGRQAWSRLHPAIRARVVRHDQHDETRHRGTMDLEASWLGRAFAILALAIGGPLPIRTGRGLPSEVTVTQDRAEGGQVWTRRYAWPGGGHSTIVSIKRCAADGVLECLGRGFAMRLRLEECHGALAFVGIGYVWSLGRPAIPWPTWASPGRCTVLHQDLGQGHFRFALEIVHPWFGRTFRQVGIFTTEEP